MKLQRHPQLVLAKLSPRLHHGDVKRRAVQTWLFHDDVAHMSLSAVHQRAEKQLKLLRRLATDDCQQLLVRSERRPLCTDYVSFRSADDLVGQKLIDKS